MQNKIEKTVFYICLAEVLLGGGAFCLVWKFPGGAPLFLLVFLVSVLGTTMLGFRRVRNQVNHVMELVDDTIEQLILHHECSHFPENEDSLLGKFQSQIIKLHQKLDTTFVYVTHDQTEAMTMGDRIVVMKGGEIQQADTPQTLYDHPCNLFVAGFIGSPQMNFMDAELGRDADGYKLTFADQSLHFAGSDALSEYVGKTVVFGIRPENLHTSGEKFTANKDYTLTMHVDIAELMGAEIYAHCTCDGTSVTVRTPSGEPIHAGDTITAAVDMSRIHLFDKQTERAIAF